MHADHTSLTPDEWVSEFTRGDRRYHAYQALVDLGPAALPAIRAGLRHGHWQVRKWCAICLDRVADADALAALVPLLRDPKAAVRMWAVHSLACNHCKEDVRCPVDVVPHLIERARHDESVRVRRMAVIMLATEFLDPRAAPVFDTLLDTETDVKVRAHAKEGRTRYRTAGLAR